MNYCDKRVFVSGASGVIGRELIPMLIENGATVMACDIQPIPCEYSAKVIVRRGDLNFITQEELDSFDPEIFIHLAATFERAKETYQHWDENFWHNVRLSNHLMTLMRNVEGLKRVVFPSSYLIYDSSLYNFSSVPSRPVELKETDAISPRNLTGMAKLAHEVELDFLRDFKNDKFTSVCARIFRGYGKNSRDVISRWIRDLIQGKKIFIYRPEAFFDYIYANDTAIGLLKLGLSDYEGVINLGTGRSRRVDEVLQILKKHFPNMISEQVVSEIPFEASQADLTELKKALNWTPQENLEKTIPSIIEFELSRGSNQKFAPPPNVLVTSISKKVPLIKAVRSGVQKVSDVPKIFGADADDSCIGRYFVDVFWHMPKLDVLPIDALISYCEANNIGAIIPTRDGELEYFASHKSLLLDHGIAVMVSEYSIISLCLDKLEFARIKGIQDIVIPACMSIKLVESEKFVVKERYGSGSKSIGLNLDSKSAQSHAKSLENPVYQPFRTGYEITVDAYVTANRNVKGLVIRKRDKVTNGESEVTTTFENGNLKKRFFDFLNKFDFYGHITLQAIVGGADEVHLIEVNPRVGGASMLSIHAGLDSFYWFYSEALGEDISAYPFQLVSKPLKLVRYAEDIYI